MGDARFYGTAALIVGIALALRLYRLGTLELWLDEAFSHHIASLPGWFGSLLIDNNPPGYYLLLRVWMAIAGHSEFALRLISALSGTIFTALAIWAAREIFSREAGLWAGLIAAVSPIQIYYSQEARVYALLNVLLLLSVILTWRALMTNRRVYWLGLGAAMTAALYCHYLAAIALLPAALLLRLTPERGPKVRFAMTAAASLAAFMPWCAWAFVFSHRAATGTSWIQEIWNETPKLLAVPHSLEIFAFGSHAGLVPLWMHNFESIVIPQELRFLGLAALLCLGVLAALPKGDNRLAVPDPGVRKLCLAALLFFPLAALWIISWFKPIYVVGRYDFLAYPAFALLLGFALWKVQRNWTGVAAGLLAAALLIPVCVKLKYFYEAQGTSEARSMALKLESDTRNGDVVVFAGLRALPVLYYLNRLGNTWDGQYCTNAASGRSVYCRTYPRDTEKTPAATNTERLMGSPETARVELADYLSRLDQSGTLWIALWGSTRGGRLRIPSADQYLLAEARRSGLVPVPDPASTPLIFRKFKRQPGTDLNKSN
jgi:hypothetical protein